MTSLIKSNGISKIPAFGIAASLAAMLALVLVTAPARAADPVFPIGSRIGLVPPPGMAASKTFPGFEDPAKHAGILLSAAPAAAYAELDKTVDAEALKKQGIIFEKREPIKLDAGTGFLIIGRQVAEKERYRKWLLVAALGEVTALVSVQVAERDDTYTEDVLRTALATVAARASVPDEEQLSLLPFKIGNLANFHIENVVPGRALMLVDRPKDAPPNNFDARFFAIIMPGGPAEPDARANFARLAFGEIPDIKDVRITMSEPLRMEGQPGFQTMAQAKDAHTGIDLMVVQWLRFGGGAFLQMIGIARADIWTDALTRLRTVRDSIEAK